MPWMLAIDGGGALGIGPAEYLRRADATICPVRPHACAGTSVGALLVALHAAGYGWHDIAALFDDLCPTIFERPGWRWRINPWRPKYDGRALRAAVQDRFGAARMGDLPVPTFLTAFDFHLGRPKVFGPGDATSVWYAVLCSCAAPTYFPIVDGRYGDGGLVANNPAMVGIAGAVAKLGWDLGTMRCLSLGTNGAAWTDPQVGRTTRVGWLRPLLDTFLTGNEELGTFQARALLGNRLLRVEPRLAKPYDLDAVGAARTTYRDLWGAEYERTQAALGAWLRAAGAA